MAEEPGAAKYREGAGASNLTMEEGRRVQVQLPHETYQFPHPALPKTAAPRIAALGAVTRRNAVDDSNDQTATRTSHTEDCTR